jgi:hypothetical protein
MVVATKEIQDLARQIKNQQMGETVEVHAAGLLTIQLHTNHVPAATKFKPRFEDRG